MPKKKVPHQIVFSPIAIDEVAPEQQVLSNKRIIHVTTEFASARAGGLGVVVNDITKMQVLAGNDVSVVIPFFQTDDLVAAYDFLSTALDKPIKRVSIEYKGNTIDADVYSLKLAINDSKFINIKAIKPLGEYSYLTSIESNDNPYILSKDAIKKAINLWSYHSQEVMEKKSEILSKLDSLEEVNNKIKKCSEKASRLMQEEAEYSKKSNVRDKILSSLKSETQKNNFINRVKENKILRAEMLSNIKKERNNLENKKSFLLNELLMPNYTLDGILFKIANEKAHLLSMLNSKFLEQYLVDNYLEDEKTDFIHLHHFGEEAKSLRDFFSANSDIPRAGIIKTLHSLNVKLTHLDNRPNPIKEGILNADTIHLVSKGSLHELQKSADPSTNFSVLEEDVIDFNKVVVAQNGINYDKFSLESLWNETCKLHGLSLGDLIHTDFSSLNVTEKKQLFKDAIYYITKTENSLLSPSSLEWIEHYTPDKPMLLFVGRLSKEKGYHRLEQAALSARENGATLAIMGYGDPIFEAEIISKYPEVIFLNSREDQRLLAPLIRGAADISLLTSNRETAGLVLLEAQAAGASVVSSNIPGPVSISNPDTATVFNLSINGAGVDHDIDEDSTNRNLKKCLEDAINSFRDKSKKELLLTYESNLKYAQSHSIHAVRHELNELYNLASQKASEQARLDFTHSHLTSSSYYLGSLSSEHTKQEIEKTISLYLSVILKFSETDSLFQHKEPEEIFTDIIFNFFNNEYDKVPEKMKPYLLSLQEYIFDLESQHQNFASEYIVDICSDMLDEVSKIKDSFTNITDPISIRVK